MAKMRTFTLVLLVPAVAAQGQTIQQQLGNIEWQQQQIQQQQWQQQNQQSWQQSQQQLDQGMQNFGAGLGAAIARHRERKAEEKALAQVKAQAEARDQALAAAKAADPARAEPVPTDEKPVLLACTLDGKPVMTLALYEKHARVDVTTSNGVMVTRSAAFTQSAVTWSTPIVYTALSRVDGSFTGKGLLPALKDWNVTGACQLVSERKF